MSEPGVKTYALIGLVLIGSLGTLAGALGVNVKATPASEIIEQTKQSETCTDLLEVTTGQAEIRRVIKFSLFGPGNIHLDFAVPASGDIDFYEVTFTPENNAPYQIQVNFRYADGSQSTVFATTATPVANQAYSRRFVSPTGDRPFLINTSVAGENNIAYTIAVRGCQN